jgi:hypothetical protein
MVDEFYNSEEEKVSMRETYEYAVVDMSEFIHYENLEFRLNDLGERGFRIVTVVELKESKLVLMSKAKSKNND